MIINCKKVNEEAVLPQFQTGGSAGADLRACITKPIKLYPGARAIIPTGIAIQLPPGYEGQVRSRSGLAAKHGIGVLNGVGTIDQDYIGEISVILFNSGTQGRDAFTVNPGDRIAQLVIAKVEAPVYLEVLELKQTERGDGAFGSTGLQ